MTNFQVATDPESRPSASWAGRLAVLKSRAVPDDDPRIIECRQALAYHRVQRAINAETGQLSRPGVDRLLTQLRGAAS
ncbi:hypothetical protein BST11_21020 [Mycobacterium alsense]|uniref:Uncharacterized protein n=1 Tax=Mycobacterium alsense TaxID=324058 RepID=A0ABX3R4A4_9MYCO|nr:hypothetical protein BST11_21020 [Mycobacterium alsense]